ncbi:MAG: hypothetical protein O2894_10105 [Planctomycetota bacterium]|nr:hypothetical protein [Planctomycetota bacterium]
MGILLVAVAATILLMVILYRPTKDRVRLSREPDVDDGSTMEDVRRALLEGDRIEAIRRYRVISGSGLREAAEAVDTIAAGGPPPIPTMPFDAYGRHLPMPDEAVRTLAHGGRKVEAVKLYREQHGLGLKEAVDAVDTLLRVK